MKVLEIVAIYSAVLACLSITALGVYTLHWYSANLILAVAAFVAGVVLGVGIGMVVHSLRPR
jgi:hypothetical protein